MSRTLDATAHALRRDAFVDAGQRLIQRKGYEQMSIQDVLDELDASRGAFYHYFDSKQALLLDVVQRMVDGTLGGLSPMIDDPNRSAIAKFVDLFGGIASWKAERMELMLAVMRVWLSDDNAIVREKFRQGVAVNLTPILERIVRQGVAEGSFSVTSPDHAARVLVSLVLGANEHAANLFGWQAGVVPFETIEGALDAYPEAFERILGAPPGSLRWIDRESLRQWFVDSADLKGT